MRIKIKNSIDAYFEILPLAYESEDDISQHAQEIGERDLLLAEVQKHFVDGSTASPTEIYDILSPIIQGVGSDKLMKHLLGTKLPSNDGEKLVWLSRQSIGRIVYGD